jgi:hypothetical protein
MTVVQFLIRSLVGRTLLASVNLDRKLQAFRHREGMGKNWRSYRRGCGRRFIFARSSMPVVLVSARIDAPLVFCVHFNCYNFMGQPRQQIPPSLRLRCRVGVIGVALSTERFLRNHQAP